MLPMRADFFGDTLVGPTILQWGTEEQKRAFIPRILDGTIAWCQGFSEPDAGSDLASLTTRATLDGDEWVVSGQKVWTTQAQFADYIFLLARTDPEAPKHQGISYLLVPMKQPGVEVRPIKQIDGSSEFNEVFFADARCPVQNVVGGVNNGWKVAMTTLGFERGASSTTGHRRFQKELDQVIEEARRCGRITDPTVRQGLAHAWSKVKIMQINGYRSLTDALHGTHHAAALGAMHKMLWSEYHQHVMDLAVDVLGMEGQILTGSDDTDDAFRRSRPRRHRLPGERPPGLVLLQPVGDHLGRHGRDPAQHRGRARARLAEGAAAGLSQPRRQPASRQARPGCHTAQVTVVVAPRGHRPEAGRAQDGRQRVVLVPAQLEHEPPATPQQPRGVGDDPAHQVEAVTPAVEGPSRLVATDVGGEEAQVRGGDVGSHRRHDVEHPVAERTTEIARHRRDAVAPGAGGGAEIDVHTHNRGRGDRCPEVHGHGPGPGAQVGGAPPGGKQRRGESRQRLALEARDIDTGIDAHGLAAEPHRPHDPRQRLTLFAPAHPRFERAGVGCGPDELVRLLVGGHASGCGQPVDNCGQLRTRGGHSPSVAHGAVRLSV